MKYIFLKNKKGLTLTELIVATVMIAIVMVGVAAFTFAVKSIQGTSRKASITSMRLAAVMSKLRKDAMLAVGDINNLGIVSNNTGDDRGLCFRHDADNDPATYTGDQWVCYVTYGTGDTGLRVCEGLASADTDCGQAGPPNDKQLIELTSKNYFSISLDGQGRLAELQITLTARDDSSAVADPLENPEYTLTTKVFPVGHSW
ncbi:MAG: prepilin-type N-terminal cleavage/methylation domain-containing protein [Candidatus Omnitrophica bacterium]|nr:prepilin-type N-terminal cleavage/methylation domain-containing protein [Candidatus Omnitrophota bacterium]